MQEKRKKRTKQEGIGVYSSLTHVVVKKVMISADRAWLPIADNHSNFHLKLKQ